MTPCLRINVPAAFALLLGFLAVLPARAAEQAGVAAAVRGQVQLSERSGAVGRKIQSGEPVFLGNAIASGPNSGMQVILLDETTFTIGPNSRIVIDEFVYDPRTNAGKVAASVAKGAFRFVTGKIAREQPGAMQVRLPAGTIGIRGTSGAGQVNDNGDQQVVLLGPGNDTEANNKGGLDLILGNLIVSLIRSGWGSTLIGGGPWGPPQRLTPEAIANLLALLQVIPQPGESQPTPPANQHAGQPTTDEMRFLKDFIDLNSDLIYAQLLGNEQSLLNRDRRLAITGVGSVANGQTSYDQLRTVNTGQFFWSQTGVPLNPLSNTYSVYLNIDFGARTIGGGNSRVEISSGTVGGGSAPIGAQAYGALNGFASIAQTTAGAACSGTCTLEFLGRLFNQGGVIARDLLHNVTLRNTISGAIRGTGSGTASGRTPGQAPAAP